MGRRKRKRAADALAVECVMQALISHLMPTTGLEERRAFVGALTSRALVEARRRAEDDEERDSTTAVIARLVPEP